MNPHVSPSQPRNSLLETYLHDVKKYHGLSIEEELDLANRLAEGDFEAREQLICAHLWLVVVLARQYSSRSLGLDDIVEEGTLGLLRAVETFDPHRGTRFSTYAAFWIRQSIRRGVLNTEGTIRVPYHTMRMLFEWRRCQSALQSELGREPLESEIVDSLNWKPRQVETIRSVLRALKANHQDHIEKPSDKLHHFVEHREERPGLLASLDDGMVNRVLELVDELPERDALVLRLRFGLDGGRIYTQKEVGDRLGLTKARICQLEKTALKTIRQKMQEE